MIFTASGRLKIGSQATMVHVWKWGFSGSMI
jgi:hypothetical protein